MAGSEFPLVTVITPTYNRADLLPETVESVLAQDYPNFEYLILDDGSTDNTREVIARYDDPRLSYHYHDNMGESRTVNRGFELAQGAFVVVVNSDDPILPGLLRNSVAVMQQNPDVLVTYPDWLMIDEQSQPMKTKTVPEYAYSMMLQGHYCPVGPGAMIRRRAIELEHGRDPAWRYVGDYEFWLRVGLNGPFLRIPQVLAQWRQHEDGASTAHANKRMAWEHVNVVRDYYRRADLPQSVLTVKRDAVCNAFYIAGLICFPENRHAARQFFLRAYLHYPGAPRTYTHMPHFRRNCRLMLRVIFVPRWVELIGVWVKRRVVTVAGR